ncbi:MAG: endolytic transglycosylase MltG [Firmicutes bacterium]|nr:endolytic transglycosylase MltG [Bacillota bacterium]
MIWPSMGRQLGWRGKKWRIIGTALVVAVLIVVGLVLDWVSPRQPGSHMERYVVVKPGQSATAVGEELQQHGIIRSAWAFQWLSRINGLDTHLTAGVYRLSPRDSLFRIMNLMRNGDVVVIKVSIPEGLTVQDIVARLVAHHIGRLSQYQRLMRYPLPGMPKPAPGVRDPWEGYLFPATYFFPYGTTPREALTMMWETFQARAIHGLYDQAHTPLSLPQWVTLASIVQAEDKEPSQARIVAGVFLNRLKRHMLLQSDATVRYALGKRFQGSLTLAQLSTPSPYNTYQHAGLPPGPIDNPGLDMLKATLHPAAVPYLYFVSLPSGRLLFAVTYAQQLANERYAETQGAR